MKIKYLIGGILLISSLPIMAKHGHQNHKNNEWQTISIAPQMEIIDDEGVSKTIAPACAFDSLPSPIDGSPLDNSFRFYFKEGKSKNVLVYFNGGGSCWNDATCVASLALASVEGNRPTYNPSVLEENSPIDAGGVFDDENRKNPFKNWSKVFIPYCTGDLHAGSNEVTYQDVDGSITGFAGAPVAVKHHGYDNAMAVREWMKNHFSGRKKKIKKLLVAGSSAGGYGATLNFPYIQAAFPKTKVALFADASASVVTEGFVNEVFSSQSKWNLQETLAPIFANDLSTFSASGLNIDLFERLSQHYPRNRFAQYSTELDFVQVLFFKVMDQNDLGNFNPFTWELGAPDYLYFAEWNARMTASFEYLSETTHNYQYYIGEGNVHTILTDDFATDDIPHPFYDERSAQNIKFSRWLAHFVYSGRIHDHSVQPDGE
ncbi:pectin acetylesterase-family hydrolase [Paraglaciecola sp. 20A4]|uniref:pectin acetylesterase-family hydrolase n=1 Tax=Paraglaciecola sp. 20A4 TaxID=2687288 RepID=UPI00140E7726|nr:pectin acetylesterase-family hydrolase [Paraglaciecola sp. 20A4]